MDEKTGEKTRSGLWFNYWEAIRVLRPRFCIIENVGALVKRGLETVLSNLAEIGYNAEWQDIRAEDLGAPHKRERIWIVCYPEDVYNEFSNSQSSGLQGHHRDDRSRRSVHSVISPKNHLSECKRKWNNWWASAPHVRELVDGLPESLGTFEGRLATKSYKRADQLKGLGNAIVPQTAELLFNLIKEYL